MSRSARRAMASASEKAKRAAGKIGRFVPVSSREARVKVVQCIYHPFFAGMIVGVTVFYVVNNGFPTVQNKASSGGISTDMAYGSYDAQYQEHIRPPWYVTTSARCGSGLLTKTAGSIPLYNFWLPHSPASRPTGSSHRCYRCWLQYPTSP